MLLAPGLYGRHWEREDFAYLGSETSPVVSLMELNFKVALDLENLSSSASLLLASALEYVATIPGCIAIYCGKIMENEKAIMCLIHWSSAKAWKRFQESMGFGIVSIPLGTTLFNRAFPPQGETLEDMVKEGATVQALSFTISGEVSEETKIKVEKTWAEFLSNSDLELSTCSGWLERDVACYNPQGPDKTRLEAEQTLALTQPFIYISFLKWSPVKDQKVHNLRETTHHLAQLFAESGSAAFDAKISILTIHLQKYQPRINSLSDVHASSLATSTASLLDLQIQPRCGTVATVKRTFDFVAYESVQEVRAQKREFPLPYGCSWPMGDINQYSVPTPASRPVWNFLSESVWDTFWLDFNPAVFAALGNHYNAATQIFHELRVSIQRISECEVVRWSYDEEQKYLVALVICWKTPSARVRGIHEATELISTFSTARMLSKRPTLQTFPSFFPLRQDEDGWIEISTFHVPTKEVGRQPFEQVFFAFQKTTIPGGSSMIPTSVTSFLGGCEASENADGVEVYTTVFAWVSPQARQQWYAEFSAGALESYERLGWMVDAMKILTKDIKSNFLKLMPEDVERP